MDIKKIYKNILSSNYKYLILISFVGIFLIFISTTKKREKPNKTKVEKTNFQNSEEYATHLENKLNKIISKIKGVGRSEVLVTLENGFENIYANSEKTATNSNENFSGKMSTRNDSQKDIAMKDTKEGKQPVVITQKEPKIKGVLIVCEGANDGLVVEQIHDAVLRSFNIKANQLSVVKRTENLR
jgi:stage III sporulation protein AG